VAQRLIDEVPRLDPERVEPIVLGLDHITSASAPDQPGEDLADVVKALKGKRFVVVLGNDFQHKNRDFAIKVWQRALQAGEPCDLVLAGLHVKSSSSKDAEDDLRARHLDLRGTIHTVGHVSSPSRAWLLANATVALYPSSAEGFGFVPYEAAALGTPTVFTDFGPLKEVAQAPGLPTTWSVEAHAADLTALLGSEEARTARVTALTLAIQRQTWRGFAAHLTDFFRRITLMPEVPTSSLATESGADAAALAAVLSSRSYRAAEKLRKVLRR
jgi:glycosyltransferase involved in cell wall biosynthesis